MRPWYSGSFSHQDERAGNQQLLAVVVNVHDIFTRAIKSKSLVEPYPFRRYVQVGCAFEFLLPQAVDCIEIVNDACRTGRTGELNKHVQEAAFRSNAEGVAAARGLRSE